MGAIQLNMAPNKKGEIILNFNNNFDPEVLQKLSKLLSSAKGNELKQQLGSLDKDAVLKKFSQLNISHNDINGIRMANSHTLIF